MSSAISLKFCCLVMGEKDFQFIRYNCVIPLSIPSQIIRVNLRHDSSGDENEPVQEDSRLVPVSMNIPQTGSNSNKLGNLEVSRTKVMFTQTCVGKVSEESLWLKNDGPDMLRWMFSSFASPYLQKVKSFCCI